MSHLFQMMHFLIDFFFFLSERPQAGGVEWQAKGEAGFL